MKYGNIGNILDDMEHGVYNFCKDGKCIECGNCCSNILPLSESEIKDIERYIKKKHITECNHLSPNNCQLDLTCPFLDTSKDLHKCKIYPVRPKICRIFKCDQPPSKINVNKELFAKTRRIILMREQFFNNKHM